MYRVTRIEVVKYVTLGTGYYVLVYWCVKNRFGFISNIFCSTLKLSIVNRKGVIGLFFFYRVIIPSFRILLFYVL